MSDPDLELDRLRRAFASHGEGAAPTPACPPAERLWSAVQGELSPEEVRPLVAHLVDCGACAEAWRLAREVGPRGTEGTAAVSAPRGWGGWAALAAGIAGVAVASLLLQRQSAPTPGYRQAPSASPGEIRSLLPEAPALPRSRFLLRWTAGPQGATYAVQVATDKLEPIADARGLGATEYLVPADRLAALPSGARLLWRVEAVTPAGVRLGSATFVSRLE